MILARFLFQFEDAPGGRVGACPKGKTDANCIEIAMDSFRYLSRETAVSRDEDPK